MTTKCTQHDRLVLAAARWLKGDGYSVVITELSSSANETPDAIGLGYRQSTVIECKTSRADFLRDGTKPCRQGRIGLGTFRYYLTREGLIDPGELPENWGLIELQKRNKLRTKVAANPLEPDRPAEMIVALSVIRRLGWCSVNGISIKPYKIHTQNRATLGVRQEEIEARRVKMEVAE